jgi:SAM-dependent methyltransferase
MALYDSIGTGYAGRRRPDPRIAARLMAALGDARRIVNVGAGTGSYEPRDRDVVAVEPSGVMVAQRAPEAAPAVLAGAERLPFADDAFDAALAVLTVHHWTDPAAGLAEMRRVASGPVVVLTCDPETGASWWLPNEYAPEIGEATRRSFLDLDRLATFLGGRVNVEDVPIPARCEDAFLMSFWDRPELVLDPAARAATSGFAQLPAEIERRIVSALAADLADGTWEARYGPLLRLPELDVGCRLVVAR